MSGFFELDINKYTLQELKDLLNLHEPFTMEHIVQNEDNVRERLLADQNVNKNRKKAIIVFLDSVKTKLMQHAKKKFISHNVIPRQPQNIRDLNPISRPEASPFLDA